MYAAERDSTLIDGYAARSRRRSPFRFLLLSARAGCRFFGLIDSVVAYSHSPSPH